jgi:hypothetical protein
MDGLTIMLIRNLINREILLKEKKEENVEEVNEREEDFKNEEGV